MKLSNFYVSYILLMSNDEYVDLEVCYTNIVNRIVKKDLDNMYVVCETENLKPIRKNSYNEFKKYIKEKAKYYKNKNIAYVRIKYDAIKRVMVSDESDVVLCVNLIVFEVDDDGTIEQTDDNSFSCSISYTVQELVNYGLTISDLLDIINNVSKRRIVSPLITPLSYTSYLKKIKRR